MNGIVLQHLGLALQVCVPSDWDDEKVKQFAESAYPCGTKDGWFIRRGKDARVNCAEIEENVHILLEA